MPKMIIIQQGKHLKGQDPHLRGQPLQRGATGRARSAGMGLLELATFMLRGKHLYHKTKIEFNICRAQIASQGEHLMNTVNICGDHPSPGECEAAWPAFWSRMGPLVWRGHFSHMCEDREAECGPSPINYSGNLTVRPRL